MTRTILPEHPAPKRSGGKRPFSRRGAAAPAPVEPEAAAPSETPADPVLALPQQAAPVDLLVPAAAPEQDWATDALAEAAQWSPDDLPSAPYGQAAHGHDASPLDHVGLWHTDPVDADDPALWAATDAFEVPAQAPIWQPEPAAAPVPVAAWEPAPVDAPAHDAAELAAAPLPVEDDALVEDAPPARAPRGGSPIVPAAAGLAVVGALGGWAVARHLGLEPLVLAGFAWWVTSAVVLSLLVRRSTTTAAIVSLFLFVFAGLPVVAGATAQGLAQRVSAVVGETFYDFSAELDAELGAVSSDG